MCVSTSPASSSSAAGRAPGASGGGSRSSASSAARSPVRTGGSWRSPTRWSTTRSTTRCPKRRSSSGGRVRGSSIGARSYPCGHAGADGLREEHVHDVPQARRAARRARRGLRARRVPRRGPARAAAARAAAQGRRRPARRPARPRAAGRRARPRREPAGRRRAHPADGRAPGARAAPDRRARRPRGARPALRARPRAAGLTVVAIDVTHITDPGCPWAYSARPAHAALRWRYGNALDWRLVVIGLTEEASQYEARGYTPERSAQGYLTFRRRYGMPIRHEPRARVCGTGRACRALVAVRRTAPEREEEAFRALQFAWFTTTLVLDDD